jgi:hypothetical protein
VNLLTALGSHYRVERIQSMVCLGANGKMILFKYFVVEYLYLLAVDVAVQGKSFVQFYKSALVGCCHVQTTAGRYACYTGKAFMAVHTQYYI